MTHAAWALWTLALTLAFGRIAAYNLGNYRPVSNDEMELMAVAYKWATQGVLGSDLYAGFFNADQHFANAFPTSETQVLTEYQFTLGVDYRPSIARAIE